MSLYNMMFGFNPACILLMPMLGRRENEYPRFRDCYLSDDKEHIVIYTRVGGNNRDCGFGEDALYDDPNFYRTYDDDYDTTYASYEFNVPEKWRKDFDFIVNNEYEKVSDEYVDYVKSMFPNITEQIDQMFKRNSKE